MVEGLEGHPALPSLALCLFPWHWQIPAIGPRRFLGSGAGLVLADTLPLPPQETGPFLHIGIVGGMTLLAWPLASVIYRTRNTGNPPPRGPHLPLWLGAQPPAPH